VERLVIVKGKVVPLHALAAFGGRGAIDATLSYLGIGGGGGGVGGQRQATTALYPWGNDPGTHCTGS
jgi:hypothetical protein